MIRQELGITVIRQRNNHRGPLRKVPLEAAPVLLQRFEMVQGLQAAAVHSGTWHVALAEVMCKFKMYTCKCTQG